MTEKQHAGLQRRKHFSTSLGISATLQTHSIVEFLTIRISYLDSLLALA